MLDVHQNFNCLEYCNFSVVIYYYNVLPTFGLFILSMLYLYKFSLLFVLFVLSKATHDFTLVGP